MGKGVKGRWEEGQGGQELEETSGMLTGVTKEVIAGEGDTSTSEIKGSEES